MNISSYRIFATVLLSLTYFIATAQNYNQYHTSIIEAERQIFIKEHLQEGLNIYRNTFQQYDFVFLTDVLQAMQIALLLNDENSFLTLADKATKNGLIPRHLINFSFIKNHPLYTKHKDSIINLYKINRPHYLKRIDTTALVKMYDLYAFDQMQKNSKAGESEIAFRKRYMAEVENTRRELIKLVRTRGFPSDKTIGIYQKDIVNELGLKTGKDLLYYYYDYYKGFNYQISKGQFELNEWEFSSKLFWPIMAHYYTQYGVMQRENDEFYLEQIKMGNVHPRDLAYTFDFAYTANAALKLEKLPEDSKIFCIIKMLDLEHKDHYKGIPFSEINKRRKKYFIAPLEQDFAKITFAKKYGIYIPYANNCSR